MKFNERLKLARKIEGYTQAKMAGLLKIKMRSVQRFEKGEQEPRHETIKKLCNAHPKYAYWLMANEVDSANHISPYIANNKSFHNLPTIVLMALVIVKSSSSVIINDGMV